ncbi:MAG: hypothetical protein ACLU3F_00230 [Blautia wexlerae]
MKKLPRRRSGREKHGMKHRALQKRYRQDLPKQKEQALQCRQKYEARMAAFGLTMEQWQAVTQQYTREEADLFQEKLDAHKAQQAQAQGRYTSAKEQIGAQGKPDLEVLQQNLQEAEQVWKSRQEEREQWGTYARVNSESYARLMPKMEEARTDSEGASADQ